MDRSLTAARLAQLLARLDPDADRGGEEYERLRQTLVRFFDWRGVSAPDLCADETIDRLARRLDQTAISDLRSYALGIARLVLLEHRRQPALEPLAALPEPAAPLADNPAGEDIASCFERCLGRLAAADRDLAVAYYTGDRAAKIASRRDLAVSLGVTENALRIRVRRIRLQIERCVRECLTR